MKRPILLLASVMLLTGVTLAAFAYDEDRTTVTIKPSSMKDGETKTFTEDGRKITIRRDGDSVNVQIDGAGQTRSVVITSSQGGDVVIRHGDHAERPYIIAGPRVPRVRVHGAPLSEAPRRLQKVDSWFVCPKDKTMLRVPEGKDEKEYKCPVDGTVMEKKKGRGFGFFFDEDELEISL